MRSVVGVIAPLNEPAGPMSSPEAAATEPGQTSEVLRNSALMATGTVASRITGVIRDICIAAAIGSFMLADTYALGNSLPNIIYILVVGGALNAIFVPQLVRAMQRDDDGGAAYADRLLTLVGLVLIILSIAAVLLAPWIVRIYATAEYGPNELSLATAFARYCLPQIFFYGIYTMFSQVLNARLHFGAPMFAPIVNNVVMIATAITFMWVAGTMVSTSTITPGQTALLGIGTTVGVAAQALVLIPVLARVGYKFRPRFDWRGHGLGKAGSLAGWTIGLVLVNQIGFLVISRLATEANVIASQIGGTPQGLATYQRAFLVFMLPHSVITISLVTALLPRMSKAAAEHRLNEVATDVSEGMRLIGALIIPCVAFLGIFGPMVGTLFFSVGANRGAAATYTGLVVSAFAIALLPFSLFYMLLRGWYSVEDTRTPFLVTVLYNIIAIPLTIVLFMLAPDHYKVVSLALAYGIAYWITVVFAWILLRRRLGSLDSRHTVASLAKMVVAALVSAAIGFGVAVGVVAAVMALLDKPVSGLYSPSWLTALGCVVIGGIVTVVLYVAGARLFRIRELAQVTNLLGARIPGRLGRFVAGDPNE